MLMALLLTYPATGSCCMERNTRNNPPQRCPAAAHAVLNLACPAAPPPGADVRLQMVASACHSSRKRQWMRRLSSWKQLAASSSHGRWTIHRCMATTMLHTRPRHAHRVNGGNVSKYRSSVWAGAALEICMAVVVCGSRVDSTLWFCCIDAVIRGRGVVWTGYVFACN